MQPETFTLTTIIDSERAAHAAISASIRGADGVSQADMTVREIARTFGLDGDTTAQTNERLDNGK